MPAPTPHVRHVRRTLVLALGAAVAASAALPPVLTGVHPARAAGATLPQAGRLADPAIVAPSPGTLELFYPTTNGSLVHAHSSDGAADWGGGENLGGVIIGGAAATAPSRESITLMVRGSNNRLYTKSGTTGSWSGWLDLGGILSAKPGVASSSGRLDVFVRGADGHLWTKSQLSGGWTGWSDLGGSLAAGSGPAATAIGDGSVAAFVHGSDGALYRKTRTAGGVWSGWYPLGGQLLGTPGVAALGAGRLAVFVRGLDNRLYEKTAAAGSWSGWLDRGGQISTSPAAAAAEDGGRTDVVVLGTDGRLWQTTPTNASSGWTAITPAALLKAALGGLMTRGVPSSTEAPYLGGFAVVIDWREVEPQRGRYDFTFIDARVATARKYGMGVRLRVNAGTQAPDWAKGIGGAPVKAYDHQRHVETTIGRFWTAAYQSSWRELQSTLAARYDANPTVREVNVSGTGVLSSEVMLLMATDKVPSTGRTNGAYWLAAGYTEAQRQAALAGDIEFMATAWPHTRLDLCLHPMQTLDATGKVTSTVATTVAVFDQARAAHPSVHAFHTGFGIPIITGTKTEPRAVYDAVLARRAPFDVQTLNIDAGIGAPATVLPWAASHGMLSIELPGGKAWESWDKALLTATNNRLKANAAAIS